MNEIPESVTATAMTDEQVQAETTALTNRQIEPGSLLSIIKEAAISKADAATMRELLNVWKDAKADQAREAFANAMVMFRKSTKPIVMTGERDDRKTGGKVHYKYAELTSTMVQITAALNTAGLTPNWRTVKNDRDWVEIECVVTHILGHKESSLPLGAKPEGPSGQTDAQKRSGTITTLQRKTLFMALGLTATEDDADLASAEKGMGAPKPPKPPSATDENKAKREFWALAQQKAKASFTADQAKMIFIRVQQASGKQSAVECLAFLRGNDVLVAADGRLSCVTGSDGFDDVPDSPAAVAEPSESPSSSESVQPPVPDLKFECDECLKRYAAKPADGQCTNILAAGKRCRGQVVATMKE